MRYAPITNFRTQVRKMSSPRVIVFGYTSNPDALLLAHLQMLPFETDQYRI